MQAGVLFSVLTLTFLGAAAARANDSVMGGSGANLMPMKTSDVSMQSEDITLTYTSNGLWAIDARYEFRNTSDRTFTLQLGFPEYRCDQDLDEDCVDPSRYRFQHMHTLVRGEAVPQRRGKVSRKHVMAGYLAHAWLFDVTFQRGETVPVQHTYQVPGASVVDGTQSVIYVTRTGALWAGPIGLARFRVRVPERAVLYLASEQLPRVTPRFVTVDGIKYAELTYELHDWLPDDDLAFNFRDGTLGYRFDHSEEDPAPEGPAHAGLPPQQRCQSFWKLYGLAEELSDPRGAPPDDQTIQAAFNSGINTRRICRNTVYAVYGQRFKDEQLNRYFYGPKGFTPDAWPYGVLRPNPRFEPSWLTKADYKLLELLERLPETSTPTPTPTPTPR